MSRSRLTTLLACALVVLASVVSVQAGVGGGGVVTDNNLFFTPAGIYDTGPGPISNMYPGTGVVLTRLTMSNPTGPNASLPPPTGGGRPTTRTSGGFFDVFADFLEMGPVTSTGSMYADMDVTAAPGIYQTEIISMNLTGGGFPTGMMIRESPSLPSMGQTAIQELGGGLYHIDSFFDVFTELSLDGGLSWAPSQGAMHMSLQGISPEPASALVLVTAGFALLRRRRES
ncbi:MAG: hypothetical protein ACREJC_20955 [Tepidisphaeraceae bacterium]